MFNLKKVTEKMGMLPAIAETKGLIGLTVENFLKLLTQLGAATLDLLKLISGAAIGGALILSSLWDIGSTFFNKELKQRKIRYVTSVITLGVAAGLILPVMLGLFAVPPLVLPLVFLGITNMFLARETAHLQAKREEIKNDEHELEMTQDPSQRRAIENKISINRIHEKHMKWGRNTTVISNIAIGLLITSALVTVAFPPLGAALFVAGLAFFTITNLVKWGINLHGQRAMKEEQKKQAQQDQQGEYSDEKAGIPKAKMSHTAITRGLGISAQALRESVTQPLLSGEPVMWNAVSSINQSEPLSPVMDSATLAVRAISQPSLR